MRKLFLTLAGLLAACGAPKINNPSFGLVQKVAEVQQKVSVPGRKVEVEYDPYYFRFKSKEGEFEHAELYENSKRYLCFESLKPNEGYFPSGGRRIILYDNDWSPNCDGAIDQVVRNYYEYKKKKFMFFRTYTLFERASAFMLNFKITNRVGSIRQEWLERKDKCKKKCSFEYFIK